MKRAAKVGNTITVGEESCGTKRTKISKDLGANQSPKTNTKKRKRSQLKVFSSEMREITKDSLFRVGDPLVSLGPLCQGRILRRPSQHIKSPYVADVELDPQFGGGEVIQMLIFVTSAFNTITFNHFHFLKRSSRWQTLTGFFG